MSSKSSPRIGIVGGNGKMGRWFTRLFEEAGLPVLVSDLDTALRPEDLASSCDVVILSVPMEAFPDVVRRTAPFLGRDAFLTDLCSLKETQVACMLDACACEVAGTHPLFGPAEDSIAGQRVAICPGRGKRWLGWWEGFLRCKGAVTHMVSPAEHDRIMAWVQALNHYLLLSLGSSLRAEGVDLSLLSALATPSFERQMRIVARLALQDPELYATIQMANPHTDEVLSSFDRQARRIMDCICRKDRKEFVRIFAEVQEIGRKIRDQDERKAGGR